MVWKTHLPLNISLGPDSNPMRRLKNISHEQEYYKKIFFEKIRAIFILIWPLFKVYGRILIKNVVFFWSIWRQEKKSPEIFWSLGCRFIRWDRKVFLHVILKNRRDGKGTLFHPFPLNEDLALDWYKAWRRCVATAVLWTNNGGVTRPARHVAADGLFRKLLLCLPVCAILQEL